MTTHHTPERLRELACKLERFESTTADDVENAEALRSYATFLKQAEGELPPLPSHPEPMIMTWSKLELKSIQDYANLAIAHHLARHAHTRGIDAVEGEIAGVGEQARVMGEHAARTMELAMAYAEARSAYDRSSPNDLKLHGRTADALGALRRHVSSGAHAEAAAESVTPNGWLVHRDVNGWVYFRRPDDFRQAVTPHEPLGTHSETLFLLLSAMLATSQAAQPSPQAAQEPEQPPSAAPAEPWRRGDPWPEGYATDPNGVISRPLGAEPHWSFGYEIGFAEAWEILTRAQRAASSKGQPHE